MRTEQPLPTAAPGVHPVSERTWKALVGLCGQCPPHNVFVTMATLTKEVSRTRARDDFQVLNARDDGHLFQEDATMHETVTREQTPVPVLPEAAELAALRRMVEAQALELRQLREVVETIPLDGRALPPRLAKVEAQQASLWGAVQGLEEQLRLVVVQVQGHDAVVMTVQELLTLLSANDDAFDSLERLIRPVSTHSQRTLQRFLWGKIGRKLHTNDFIPAS